MVEVSIIIPCYNSEKTIEKCINSIKNQSFKDFEALIIDDGSTDQTTKIIKKIIIDDKRFKYYYTKNKGLSHARNYGLDRFKGKYISFVDSDDYIEEDYIRTLYQTIKENKTKISICSYKIISKNNEKEVNISKNKVELNIHPSAWCKMFHNSFFTQEKLRFPYGKFYEDLCLISKIIFTVGENYSIVNKSLYNYIQYDDSIMHTSDNRIFHVYDILNDITSYCKQKGIYDEVEKKIEFMWIYHVLCGTIFRASTHKEFSKEMIKKIINKVTEMYPKWRENKYIKENPFVFRMYITLLKYNQINLIYFLIKHLNGYMQEKRMID